MGVVDRFKHYTMMQRENSKTRVLDTLYDMKYTLYK